MNSIAGQLAVVTGASTGIGLELARLCAQQRWDLIIAADEPRIEEAARELAQTGIQCTAVQCDLATAEGVAQMKGELKVVAGFANKMRAVMSHVAPDSTLAEMHRSMAEPGSGKDEAPQSKQERTDRPRV
jgi:short-subunit dehydrogenase